MKPILRSVVAGAVWGAVFAMLLARAPWYFPTGMLVSGPLIGLSVYATSRWSYRSIYSIAGWTVPSVYLATLIFGLVMGFLDSLTRGPGVINEAVVVSLYGITVPSRLWLIFPLAFITHLWVRAAPLGSS